MSLISLGFVGRVASLSCEDTVQRALSGHVQGKSRQGACVSCLTTMAVQLVEDDSDTLEPPEEALLVTPKHGVKETR